MGNALKSITGIVAYEESRFTLIPLTAAQHLMRSPQVLNDIKRASAFGKLNPLRGGLLDKGDKQCEAVTIASYNVHSFGRRPDDGTENSPASKLVRHIVTVLHSPAVLFLQDLEAPSIRVLNIMMEALCGKIGKLDSSAEYRWITKVSACPQHIHHHHGAHLSNAATCSQSPVHLDKWASSIVLIS